MRTGQAGEDTQIYLWKLEGGVVGTYHDVAAQGVFQSGARHRPVDEPWIALVQCCVVHLKPFLMGGSQAGQEDVGFLEKSVQYGLSVFL